MAEVMYFRGVWTRTNTVSIVLIIVLFGGIGTWRMGSSSLHIKYLSIIYLLVILASVYGFLTAYYRKMKVTTDGNITVPGQTFKRWEPNIYRGGNSNRAKPVLMFTRSNVKNKYQVVEPQEIDNLKHKRRGRSLKDVIEIGHVNNYDKTLCIVFKQPLKYSPPFKKLAMPNHQIHRIYISLEEPQRALAYI